MRGVTDRRPYTVVWEKEQLLASLGAAGRVLDAGAADGQYVLPWRAQATQVVALDIDATRVAQLRERVGGAPGVSIVQASIERLPFADRTFDLVWASEIVEHLRSLRVIDELERISAGRIVITLPNPRGPYRYLDRTHVLRYSIGSLQAAFAARPGWTYRVEGLGGCLPAWAGARPVRRAWLALSRTHPALAWTLVIVGTRASARSD